jgi:hypothetical protein
MGGVPTWADIGWWPPTPSPARENNDESILGRAGACGFAGVAPTSPLRLDLIDAPRPRQQSAHRLIMTSRARFRRPRRKVEGADASPLLHHSA